MSETQLSISKWAFDTFGPVTTNLRVAIRALEEMHELIACLGQGTSPEMIHAIDKLHDVVVQLRGLSVNQLCGPEDTALEARVEVADIVIVLYRLASCLGFDLFDAIDAKMAINRSHVWKQDGSGHGYHLRAK